MWFRPDSSFQPGGRRLAATIVGAAALAAVLAACTSAPAPNATDPVGAASGSTSSAAAVPATVAVEVADREVTAHRAISPTAPIRITVAHGTLSKVTMLNPAGVHVTGALTSNRTSWHTTEVLGYGKTYTVRATATNANGRTTHKNTKITTLEPAATTNVTIDRMGGYALDSGSTYGVAIVPVVHFDTAVGNEKAAERALQITTSTTSTTIDGVWSWIDDQDVAYRPKAYWPSGTKVTVAAEVYGVQVGHGLYGASDESAHFTVGRKQTTIADDNAPKGVDKVRVYNAAGTLLRTMNTSMGQHTGETIDGTYINFYTLYGTYTVLEHDNPAIMSSQSYGLPADAPNGYGKLSVPYSTKISTDGIYLHEYNSTIYDQDHGNDVSEGCLNLRTADAKWFYDHSIIGDPVVVHGAKGAPKIAPDEGGYWSISWAKWQAGSALA